MSYAKICQVASRRCSPHFFHTDLFSFSPSLGFFFFFLFFFFEGRGEGRKKERGERSYVRKIPKEWLVFFLGFQTATSSAHCERA
jgi:hypothetical protein